MSFIADMRNTRETVVRLSEALGPGWKLDRPGIFEKWPNEASE